jgi:hypothetical protein
MNKPDPNGQDEWDTIRDMKKVWTKMPAFGPSNTLLLDNEARKFCETPRNGIVVAEYGAEEARARVTTTLQELQTYLLSLASASPADVRLYLEATPFGRTVPKQPSTDIDDALASSLASSLTIGNKPAPLSGPTTPATNTRLGLNLRSFRSRTSHRGRRSIFFSWRMVF